MFKAMWQFQKHVFPNYRREIFKQFNILNTNTKHLKVKNIIRVNYFSRLAEQNFLYIPAFHPSLPYSPNQGTGTRMGVSLIMTSRNWDRNYSISYHKSSVARGNSSKSTISIFASCTISRQSKYRGITRYHALYNC